MKLRNLISKLRGEEATFISETEDLQKLTAQDAMIKPYLFMQAILLECVALKR